MRMQFGEGNTKNPVCASTPLPTTAITDTQLRATPLPVSGTFYPATQPISGSVNVGNWPALTAVTGAFWQTTQPVSIASMPSTPVTGTFWQATQPVSIASMPSTPVTGTFWQATQPVSGTVSVGNWPATQPVSLASIPALVAGSAVIGGVTQSGTWTATPPTLTKATQGANGYTTQDLKDAGRAIVNVATAIAGVTAVTSEALLALNVSRDGAAPASITSITVTSGKRFRVTGMTVGFISTSAAVLSARFSLRMNPSGAVTASSPIIATAPVSSGAALAQAGNQMTINFPDGIEFSGTMQFGISQVASAVTGTVWASLIGYEY